MRITLVRRFFKYHKIQIFRLEFIFLILLLLILSSGILQNVSINQVLYEALTPDILFALIGVSTHIIISLFPIYGHIVELIRINKRETWYDAYIMWSILIILGSCISSVLLIQIEAVLINRTLKIELGEFLVTLFLMFQTIFLIQLLTLFLYNILPKIKFLLLGCLVYILLWTASYGEKIFVFIQQLSGYWWLKNNQINILLYQSLIIWSIILILYETNKYFFNRREYYA